MTFSMAWRDRSCQAAGGDALDQLAGFRRDAYRCLWRRADALFETVEAVLAAGRVPSLPYLSLEPAFRRGHGMVYQGLAQGRIDEDALRDLLVRARPADWPCVFGIDASTIGRPWAVTSPGREFHHHSCAGHTGGGDPVIKGWAWQWLSQLSFDADSWTAPQDAVQVGRDDAAAVTAAQILAHAARLRQAGETRVPLYVMDAGYDEAPVTWELREHLDQVQILVRVRNDRVMYRDPAPEPRRPGRPRRHGQDRFECADPGTWGEPDQVMIRDDDRYGLMTVMSWGGLHPKLACRGHFEAMARPPIIKCHLIRVTVEKSLSGGRAVPGPLWLWWAGPGSRTWTCAPAATCTGSTSNMPTGSPSRLWAGTRQPCAPRRSSPAGPGSSSARSPSCGWPAPWPKTTATPGNGAAAPAGSPPAASAGISPAWPRSPARRPARRNPPKPGPAAPKAAAAPQHRATT